MKTLPLFLGTGLLCAGLALGCADTATDSGTATNTPGTNTPASASGQPEWVADASATKAQLKVTGMT